VLKGVDSITSRSRQRPVQYAQRLQRPDPAGIFEFLQYDPNSAFGGRGASVL